MEHPLRRYRKVQGLSLGELAQRLNVSVATISRLETGKQGASLALAVAIERETGVPAHKFVIKKSVDYAEGRLAEA
jgi:transcriptional regulator with XRE-family HTH domain